MHVTHTPGPGVRCWTPLPPLHHVDADEEGRTYSLISDPSPGGSG